MKTLLSVLLAAGLLLPLQAEPVLRHVVCFKFKPDASAEKIKDVEQAFVALKSKIPQIAGLEWGTEIDEAKKEKGFSHCFVVTFKSKEDLETYGPHPEHQAFVDLIKPVLGEVFVIDFWAQE